MRNAMLTMNALLVLVFMSMYTEIVFCQENKTCDPITESCTASTTAPKPTRKAPTTPTTTPTPTKKPTTKAVAKNVESPYSGGKDKFIVFAECCWELRLMYYWECDIYLKKCCMDSNITDYKPVCSSTGPGYIRWWKPYRRIFYNECSATKYLCESLPPLSVPWKCMWRRDPDHPHCRGSNKDVIRERKPPVLDCSRYGLESVGKPSNDVIPTETHYFKHPQGDAMPKWKMQYPAITLSRCGDIERPKEPEPLLPFPPTTEPTPVRFQELQELKSHVRHEREHKHEHNKTTPEPPTTTLQSNTVFFPSQPYDPPLMEIRTPESWYGLSLWAILLGVFTVLFILGCFIFSLWVGSKSETDEMRTLRQT